MTNYWLGKKRSEETKHKISIVHKGKPSTRIGYKHSPETRKKMSESQKGKHNYWIGKKRSKITREKMSLAHKGYKHTGEAKFKMSNSRKGNKHYNWKGGISHFRGESWNEIRKKIYKRDNWTCQICGKNNIKIFVHHIVPYRITQDNSEGNLITLCLSCHVKEEHKYYKNLKGQLSFNFGGENV